MQTYARVCKENKLEEKRMPTEKFFGKGYVFEGSYKKSRGTYQDDILKDVSPYIA